MAKNMKEIEAALNARFNDLSKYLDIMAVTIEEDAKANASSWAPKGEEGNQGWTNRTGDANANLHAVAFNQEKLTFDMKKGTATITVGNADEVGIALMHRVEYGKWLETMADGKYAILKPTILKYRREVLTGIRSILNG